MPRRGFRATMGRDFVEICSPHSYLGAPLQQLASLLEACATAAITLVDGVVVGVLGLADQVRCDAARAVRGLQASGHRVLVIGDGVDDAPAMAAASASVTTGAAAGPQGRGLQPCHRGPTGPGVTLQPREHHASSGR